MKKAKSFEISKTMVVEAWERVKANQGAAGVDKESIADFERHLKENLYKIWNRMSSGSYVPPPVRTVAIRRRQVVKGCWGFLPWLTEWRRWLSICTLSQW